MEGVPAVESPTRSAEPASRILEHGVLGPDGPGLESSVVDTVDTGFSPALLNEATRGSGGDGATTGGSWGTELDPVIPTLFPKDGLVSGVGMKHRGVAPAEEERMEFWKEGAGGGEVELHIRFLALAHCDSRSLVSGAAEEGKDGAAVFSRDEAGCFSSKASEAGNAEVKRERGSDRMVGSQKLEAIFLGGRRRRREWPRRS